MAAGEKFEPGAAPFGNFINYYSFNPPENRLKLLPKDFYSVIKKNSTDRPLLGIDIGCNTGELTAALLEQFSQDSTENCQSEENTSVLQTTQHTDFHILGCDIDKILIQRATENNPCPDRLTFQTLDYMNTEERQKTLELYLQRFGRAKFDVTFCFSVTMWIHLQHGDSGLRDFLRSVSHWTRFLLLEPQPWKCYRSASRRVRKLGRDDFPLMKTLKIRGDVEEEIDRCLVEGCGMRRVDSYGETQWGRKLVLYYSGDEGYFNR